MKIIKFGTFGDAFRRDHKEIAIYELSFYILIQQQLFGYIIFSFAVENDNVYLSKNLFAFSIAKK